MNDIADDPSRRVMTLARHIAAPPARVWQALSTPALLESWYGPDGFQTKTESITLGHGGHWIFDMIAPDGTRWPNRHRYQQWHPEERIDFLMDDGSGQTPAAEVSVTLAAEGEGTHLTQTILFPSEEARLQAEAFGAVPLGMQTLAKLAHVAAGL